MPNNSFFNSLLVPIRDLIMKSRPAYKDYLGRKTVTKREEIYDGVIVSDGREPQALAVSTYDAGPDDIKSLLIAGEVYSVTIGDTTELIAAREMSIEGISVAVLSTLEKFPETEEEMANLPENYWLFIHISVGDMTAAQCEGAGTFPGKTITVVREYDIVEEKYDTKLLPESVAKKDELEKANRKIAAMEPRIVNSDWSQNDETAADYVKNRPGGYDALANVSSATKTINGTTWFWGGYSDGKSESDPIWGMDSWEKAKVTYDGVTYVVDYDYTAGCIGDKNLIKYPFALDVATYLGGGAYTYCNYVQTEGNHEITLVKMGHTAVQIPAKYIPALSSENCPSGKYIDFMGYYTLSPHNNTPLFRADVDVPRPPSLYAENGMWKFYSTSIRISNHVTFEEALAENEKFTGLIFDDDTYKWGVIVVRSSDNSGATIGLKKVTAYGAEATT